MKDAGILFRRLRVGLVAVALGAGGLPVQVAASDPPGLYVQWGALKERVLPAPPSLRALSEDREDGGLALSLTFDRPARALMPGDAVGATTFRERSTAERWYPERVPVVGLRHRF